MSSFNYLDKPLNKPSVVRYWTNHCLLGLFKGLVDGERQR